MDENNPYKSPPKVKASKLNFHARFDAGKLTARYLQVWAALSVLNMIFSAALYGRFNFDISAVLMLWTAHHLMKHSKTARTWVMAICFLNVVGILLLIVIAIFSPMDTFSISYAGKPLTPNRVLVFGVPVVLLVIVSIPLWLLNTEEAKREFLA